MYMNSSPVTLNVSHTGRDVNHFYGSEVGASNSTTASGPYPTKIRTISTSNGPMFTCNSVCVSLIVVFGLILACISVGLFLALGFGCRRKISKWGWGRLRRLTRTNASVTASEGINLDIRPRPLQSANTITFNELSPVPPYLESTLPPYSPYSISHTQNIPADDIGPVVDSQTDDRISSISLTYTNFSARTSVTSVYSSHTGNSEIPIPPTLLIPTVPLPPDEPESPIDDVVQPNFLFQQNSNDARSELDEQSTRSLRSNRSIDDNPFGVGSTGANVSPDLDMESAQPTGSLGLIFFKSPASCDVRHSADLGLNFDFEEKSNSLAPHAEGDPVVT